jgi:hypothetical protein
MTTRALLALLLFACVSGKMAEDDDDVSGSEGGAGGGSEEGSGTDGADGGSTDGGGTDGGGTDGGGTDGGGTDGGGTDGGGTDGGSTGTGGTGGGGTDGGSSEGSTAPDPAACHELPLEACETAGCTLIFGSPLGLRSDGSYCIDPAADSVPLGCRDPDLICPAMLTAAHAPGEEVCYVFSDSCIPTGWEPCDSTGDWSGSC